VVAKIANLGHGGDRCSEQAANLPLISQEQAAAKLSVSARSVRDAVKVTKGAVPELKAAVERGDVAVSAAAAVSTLP
jgi:hypothetical protein